MKLGPEAARKKLVEALRSGKYDQTDRALKDREGYCCLGVACDLYRKIEDPSRQWELVEGDTLWEFMGSSGALPDEVVDWLGFATNGGTLMFRTESSLMALNDSGKSFEYIADTIEAGAVYLKEES